MRIALLFCVLFLALFGKRNGDDAAFIGVDDRSLIDHIAAGIVAVIEMDVAVKEKLRMVAFDQPAKAFKAGMTRILAVVMAGSRGVGDENIKSAMFPEERPELADTPVHFLIGILMGPPL